MLDPASHDVILPSVVVCVQGRRDMGNTPTIVTVLAAELALMSLSWGSVSDQVISDLVKKVLNSFSNFEHYHSLRD